MNANRLKNKLRLAIIAENVAGGFYLELAKDFKVHPNIALRLRKTAGDEIRHGGYFNQSYKEQFGKPMKFSRQLIQVGHLLGKVNNLIPGKWVSKQKKLDILTKGEAAAVQSLEKELAKYGSNPYLDIVSRILPDERDHAVRYQID